MSHIHTQKGQHDHTVGMYIFREDGTQPRLILHMHKKLGILLQFGGHVELNETPWQAVVHEIKEESGYDMSQLKILQPKNRITALTNTILHPYPVVLETHKIGEDHFHSNDAFAFVTAEDPAHDVDDNESKDIRLVTAAELAALTDDEIPISVKEISQFIFDNYLDDWERIDPAVFDA